MVNYAINEDERVSEGARERGREICFGKERFRIDLYQTIKSIAFALLLY